nr:MAG TPA: hypothetical protein [Caudoviricetes sp.]
MVIRRCCLCEEAEAVNGCGKWMWRGDGNREIRPLCRLGRTERSAGDCVSITPLAGIE